MFTEETVQNLDKTILEMTKNIEKDALEWTFQAIDKTIELEKTLYDRVESLSKERYPDDRRKRIYSLPYIKQEIVENEIGANVYNVGSYYYSRGSNRNLRADYIVSSIKKEFDKKRASLKNKIEAAATKENSSIKEFKEITRLDNGSLGCVIVLENGNQIIVDIISAGGWNVQCFHFRNKVTLKKVKK